ncbi:MAG: hypothetical protein AAF950_16010 [Pseudomonadota bacterium]
MPEGDELTSVSSTGGKINHQDNTSPAKKGTLPPAPTGVKGGTTSKAKHIPGMPWWLPAIVGVVILAYFGWLHSEMFVLAGDKEVDLNVWQRRWLLFVSLEAIALAAAGAILGVQIQRGRVEAAERQINQAQSAAEKANEQAKEAAEKATAQRARAEAYVASLETAEAFSNTRQNQETAVQARSMALSARRMLLD